jgi:hypothetical protein
VILPHGVTSAEVIRADIVIPYGQAVKVILSVVPTHANDAVKPDAFAATVGRFA